MPKLKEYISSSIGKKQVIALTGLLLIGFLAAHLAGNLLIFLGPDAINAYAKKLHSLGIGLKIMELGLLVIFLVHVILTFKLIMENRSARKNRYAVPVSSSKRSFATRSMRITGPILVIYVVVHLLDFTFADDTMTSLRLIEGVDMGLYGLIYNSFQIPWRVCFYLIAMICLGLHLAHAIQSVFQTYGFNHASYTPLIKKSSIAIGVIVTIAYSSIPIFIYLTPPYIP